MFHDVSNLRSEMRVLDADQLAHVAGGNGPGETTPLSIAYTGLWAAVLQNAATTIALQKQLDFYTGGCGGGSGTYAWMCA